MNNGNGMVVDEMMTYDDLFRCLEINRHEMIDILSEYRAETLIKNDGLIESLQEFYALNDIHKESEYYLQSESILYEDYLSGIKEVYGYMTNQEIVDYYRENEPYAFGIAETLQHLFNK